MPTKKEPASPPAEATLWALSVEERDGDHVIVIRGVDGVTGKELAERIARGARRVLHHQGHPVQVTDDDA